MQSSHARTFASPSQKTCPSAWPRLTFQSYTDPPCSILDQRPLLIRNLIAERIPADPPKSHIICGNWHAEICSRHKSRQCTETRRQESSIRPTPLASSVLRRRVLCKSSRLRRAFDETTNDFFFFFYTYFNKNGSNVM